MNAYDNHGVFLAADLGCFQAVCGLEPEGDNAVFVIGELLGGYIQSACTPAAGISGASIIPYKNRQGNWVIDSIEKSGCYGFSLPVVQRLPQFRKVRMSYGMEASPSPGLSVSLVSVGTYLNGARIRQQQLVLPLKVNVLLGRMIEREMVIDAICGFAQRAIPQQASHEYLLLKSGRFLICSDCWHESILARKCGNNNDM